MDQVGSQSTSTNNEVVGQGSQGLPRFPIVNEAIQGGWQYGDSARKAVDAISISRDE